MQPSEKPQFAKLVKEVLAYYRQDVSMFVMSVWWEGCKSFDYDQVSRALSSHVTNPDKGEFPPKVADVIRLLQGTKADKSALAWSKVYGVMASVGAYTDVIFDDPAIHATIEDIGGWPKVCRTETSEISYLMHRFCESYKAYAGQIGGFKYPRRLPGDRDPDSVYERHGLKLPKPALVGDPDAAKSVYQSGEAGSKTQVTFVRPSALQVVDAVATRLVITQ